MSRFFAGCCPRPLGARPQTPVVLALALMLATTPVRAQWAVFDAANFSQNVLTDARELEQINNEIQSLTNEAQMLVNQARNLESLPLSTLSLLQSSTQQTQALLAQAQNIAFDVQQIETAYSGTYGAASTAASDATLMATAQSRWRMVSQGTSRSLRLIAAKSNISGAPNAAAAALAAVTPGTISMATSNPSAWRSSIARPAMP